MKIITIVALLFLAFNLNGQVVEIPDSNFLAAIIKDGVDTNQDGLIQLSEAEVVEDLKVEIVH